MIVAFTAFHRSDYMRVVLDSWSRVVGIEDVDVTFRVEPDQPAMLDVIRTFDAPRSVTITVNPTLMGPLTNPWHALGDGFTMDNVVLLAEDDSIVSPDILQFTDRLSHTYEDNTDCLAICAFQHDQVSGQPGAYWERPRFFPTVWATWASRWDYLSDNWDHDYSQNGWDWHIGHLMQRDGLYVAAPHQSRSQHVGRDGGAHMTEELFADHQSTCFLDREYDGVYYRDQP